MGLQADTVIGAFRIRHLADAVTKKPLQPNPKHIKTQYVSSENSEILNTELTCVCFGFFFTRAQEFCWKAREILQ